MVDILVKQGVGQILNFESGILNLLRLNIPITKQVV
jgi:hypothetical protein